MDFSALRNFVEYLPKVGVPGCDLIVYKDHQEIFRCMAGTRDTKRMEPMQGDELCWIFSCTKVATTCAAMQLIESGKIHLDDPVSDYLPAYGHITVREGDDIRPARRIMTIRHLMSMQSGMDYDLAKPSVLELIRKSGGKAGTREIAEAFAEEPLQFEPGTDFLYSLSHDILGAVIEVASGERFSAYLKNHLFDPLGITGFDFRLREKYSDRFCAAWLMVNDQLELQPTDSNNYRLSENYESGGAGLLGDVKSFITLADALACSGRSADGIQIIQPETLELWRANQLYGKSRNSFDAMKRIGYSYGLGVRTRVNTSVGGSGPLGEFGWDGAAGAWNMIDIQNHVSAYFAMHVRGFGYCYHAIHPVLRSLIYEGLK